MDEPTFFWTLGTSIWLQCVWYNEGRKYKFCNGPRTCKKGLSVKVNRVWGVSDDVNAHGKVKALNHISRNVFSNDKTYSNLPNKRTGTLTEF